MKKDKILVIINNIIDYCLYGLIFVIPISKAAIEIFAGVMILSFIAKKTFFKSSLANKKSWNLTHIFLLCFVVFSGLSFFNSGIHLQMSLRAFVFKWLENFFIFLIVEDSVIDKKKLRNILYAFMLSAILVGVSAFSQYFLGLEFLRGRSIIQIGGKINAVTGPFHYYNEFAVYLVCIMPLTNTAILKGKIHTK